MIDGVKEGKEYKGMQVRGLPIAESHLYATMSNNNRLAEKDVLTLNDLKGETITVLSGDSGLMCEKLIDYIEEHNPDIILNKKDYFDYATMNEFANDGQIALDYYGGSYSHPCLVSIPLVIEGMEEEFCSKMGFMYTEPLSNAMKKFITTMQDILEETPDIMPKYERIKY